MGLRIVTWLRGNEILFKWIVPNGMRTRRNTNEKDLVKLTFLTLSREWNSSHRVSYSSIVWEQAIFRGFVFQLYEVNEELWRKLMMMMCGGGESKFLDWLLFYQDLLCPTQLHCVTETHHCVAVVQVFSKMKIKFQFNKVKQERREGCVDIVVSSCISCIRWTYIGQLYTFYRINMSVLQ